MDSDSGSNAEIEYYVSDDHFTVNSNGVISNNKKLDADSNNAYYEFIVTAKDKGEPPRTGKHTVTHSSLQSVLNAELSRQRFRHSSRPYTNKIPIISHYLYISFKFLRFIVA